MGAFELVLGIILLVAAVFLVVAILIQQGKSKGMSGAIGGGTADTFFGKTKGKSLDKTLSKLTTIIGVVFVVIVV
ncbi:MAG: preprotein translocase subunit SecG, partial [Clostridia bacterium]|nr:preprotein translocase subunit SecG [Clostridia bacterium]